MKGEKTVVPEITDRNSHEIDPHLTARIVESYVRHHRVGTGQVPELITSVHGALARLGRPSQSEEVLTPAVSIRQSVRHDYVVCLDCGYRAKMIRRHISTRHGFTPDEYLKRWGLRKDHPLTAPAYSEQRSTMAKARAFGRKPKAQVAAAATFATPASAITDPQTKARPTRRQSTRSASKSANAAESVAPSTATKRRPRSRIAPRGDNLVEPT
jgi:predicted transcriptional regulator